MGSSRKKISEYINGLGWTSNTRMAAILPRTGSLRPVTCQRIVGERKRPEHAGTGAEHRWHDVGVDVVDDLARADIPRQQLDDTAANEGQQRPLLHHAASEDDALRRQYGD